MANKGTPFERTVCRDLGLWWTNGRRDDVFWRTDTSGGRATQRAKQGKTTFGQYGDVQATDPIGQPLIDLCCIEIKRGYNKFSMADVLDKPDSGATQMWEGWVGKVHNQAIECGTHSWIIIWKRDRRETVVYLPIALMHSFREAGADISDIVPFAAFHVDVDIIFDSVEIAAMQFSDFLERVSKTHIKRVLRKLKDAK